MWAGNTISDWPLSQADADEEVGVVGYPDTGLLVLLLLLSLFFLVYPFLGVTKISNLNAMSNNKKR